MSDFSLEQLTEGIRQRHVGSAGRQLVDKWSRTGLLRGLKSTNRENMARLLENQAAQVLREASSVSTGAGALTQSGDLRGFTNIAFPIVRRVFGGLIANDLVSVQPMSLPSGLLFYLDYTSGTARGVTGAAAGGATGASSSAAGDSLYGGMETPVNQGAKGIGVKYDGAGQALSRAEKVANGVQFANDNATTAGAAISRVFSLGANGKTHTCGAADLAPTAMLDLAARFMQWDPLVEQSITDGQEYCFVLVPLTTANFPGLDTTLIKEVTFGQVGTAALMDVPAAVQSGTSVNVRRLNRLVKVTGSHTVTTVFANGAAAVTGLTEAPLASVNDTDVCILMVCASDGDAHVNTDLDTDMGAPHVSDHVSFAYPIASALNTGTGDTLVLPAMESNMDGDDALPVIPEIDIKVEAVPVVAETRKLRAKWSPELAQDLNAYHSLDAEVELTSILSEQIALEIDREILNDLLTQASAANYHWSRAPGDFVNKTTGAAAAGHSFTGTVREWYETLTETIIDVANQIHRKTLRGSANFIVVGPDVATILEASVFYKPSYSIDGDGQVSQPMVIGADQVGTLSNRFTVYKDPYFPRNKVLVGFKGGSYLETGYVYAPYVPLIVTPTIFQPEDFTPRKGVMTRYGKKMVRADFYGTVTVQKMNII